MAQLMPVNACWSACKFSCIRELYSSCGAFGATWGWVPHEDGYKKHHVCSIDMCVQLIKPSIDMESRQHTWIIAATKSPSFHVFNSDCISSRELPGHHRWTNVQIPILFVDHQVPSILLWTRRVGMEQSPVNIGFPSVRVSHCCSQCEGVDSSQCCCEHLSGRTPTAIIVVAVWERWLPTDILFTAPNAECSFSCKGVEFKQGMRRSFLECYCNGYYEIGLSRWMDRWVGGWVGRQVGRWAGQLYCCHGE